MPLNIYAGGGKTYSPNLSVSTPVLNTDIVCLSVLSEVGVEGDLLVAGAPLLGQLVEDTSYM